jgi:hypothetical protein
MADFADHIPKPERKVEPRKQHSIQDPAATSSQPKPVDRRGLNAPRSVPTFDAMALYPGVVPYKMRALETAQEKARQEQEQKASAANQADRDASSSMPTFDAMALYPGIVPYKMTALAAAQERERKARLAETKTDISASTAPLTNSLSTVAQPQAQPLEPNTAQFKPTPSAAVPKLIQIAQETKSTATLDSGQRALAGKAFNKFLRQQLKKRSPELAAKVLGASVADGPFPIGEALSLGFTVQTFYDIYQDYVKLYPPQADPSETFSPTQSQSTTAGGTHSTHKQAPINLGTVPQIGTSTNDPVDAFLKAQEAQIQQSDRQMAAKQQREAQLAVSADGRQQQRNAVDGLMRDKLYKVNSQENLSLYQTWLLQNDPKFLDRMNRQSGARYDTLTNKGQDLQFEGAEAKRSFREQLLSHTMYQNDLRAREMIEYSSMELNLGQVTNQGTGFNPKKLAQIRGNFDTVVAGGYAKQLEPKVVKYAETQANAAYLKETGNKEVDRNSPLWKTLRNVELLKYDRTLWNTVQEAPAGIMTNPNDPALGSNALNRPGQGSTLNVPTNTGHPQQPNKISPNDINKPGTAPAIDVKNHTGHPKVEDNFIKHVFDSRHDGLIPGTPEHRAARWKEYQDSGRTLDYETWNSRYNVAMQQARNANVAVDAYHEKIGWGQREVTVDAGGVKRRLDIADVKARRGIEYKTGYTSLKNPSITSEIERDAVLVKKGWNIEWVFRDGVSQPLLDALEKAGIKYKK